MLSMSYVINWEMEHAICKEHVVIRVDYSESWSYQDYMTIHLWKTDIPNTYAGIYVYQGYIREMALCYKPSTPTTAPWIPVAPIRLSTDQRYVEKYKKETGYLPVQENPIYNYYVKFLDLKLA